MLFDKLTRKIVTDSQSLAKDLLAIAQLQADAGAQADLNGIISDVGSFGIPVIFAAPFQGAIQMQGPKLVDALTKYIDLCNKVLAALPPEAQAPAAPAAS